MKEYIALWQIGSTTRGEIIRLDDKAAERLLRIGAVKPLKPSKIAEPEPEQAEAVPEEVKAEPATEQAEAVPEEVKAEPATEQAEAETEAEVTEAEEEEAEAPEIPAEEMVSAPKTKKGGKRK